MRTKAQFDGLGVVTYFILRDAPRMDGVLYAMMGDAGASGAVSRHLCSASLFAGIITSMLLLRSGLDPSDRFVPGITGPGSANL